MKMTTPTSDDGDGSLSPGCLVPRRVHGPARPSSMSGSSTFSLMRQLCPKPHGLSRARQPPYLVVD